MYLLGDYDFDDFGYVLNFIWNVVYCGVLSFVLCCYFGWIVLIVVYFMLAI